MTYKDYYHMLGVQPNASFDEIKNAYHALARRYHPDISTEEDAELLFKQASEAYKTLSDPFSRNEYNKEHGYQYAQQLTKEDLAGLTEVPTREVTQGGKREVNIAAIIGSTKETWQQVKEKQGDHDLKIHHKLVLEPEKEADKYPEDSQEEEFIPAWGMAEVKQPTKFSLKSAFGILDFFRKKSTSTGRPISKDEQKSRIKDSSAPLPPSQSISKKRHPRPDTRTFGTEHLRVNPNQEERIFNFVITSIEAALGCSRVVALPGLAGDEPRKMKIAIPLGTQSGSLIQVTKGWERLKVKISIIPASYASLEGHNLIVLLPVSIGEAIYGLETVVPTIDAPLKTKIPGFIETGSNTFELSGYGLPQKDGDSRGNIIIRSCVVPPPQITESVIEAAKTLDNYYTKPLRQNFADLVFEGKQWIHQEGIHSCITLPITLSEAISGLSVEIPTASGVITATVKTPYKLEQRLVFPGLGDTDEKNRVRGDLFVTPIIYLPDNLSDEVINAAKAIQEYYLGSVRSNLPSSLAHFN